MCDIGERWAKATGGLPLPLGGNAVRRSLGPQLVTKISRLCRASISWALEHRDETMRALLENESRSDLALDRKLLDQVSVDVRERRHARCSGRRASRD